MKPILSIVIPTIRFDNHKKICDEILRKNDKMIVSADTNELVEFVFVGPFKTTTFIYTDNHLVKYVRDFGNPVRAQQIGMCMAEGKYIMWSSDDSIFLPGAIDEAIAKLNGSDYKKVMVGRYLEGQNNTHKTKQPDSYYKLINAYGPLPNLNPDWWIFNVAFMHRKFLEELGGLNCRYQACPFAHADLAVRAYKAGAQVEMMDAYVLDCDHGQDDHRPIEIAQVYHDMPYYSRYHSNPSTKDIINLQMDNWKEADSLWKLRFN